MAQMTASEWVRAQTALRDEVSRVATLLRSVRNPDAPALGDWTVAETAMHLSQGWVAVPGLARADLSQVYDVVPELADVAGDSIVPDLWDLSDTTKLAVRSDPERDLRVLADRIEERAEAYFANCVGASAQTSRAWLVEGVTVNLPTMTYHLLNETVVHGYDIARGDGRRWALDRGHAGMILEGFLLQVMKAMGPDVMVDQTRAAGLKATFALHLRGGGLHTFVFDSGHLSIDPPSPGRIDCHITADPAAFLLVAWARKGQWGPIGKGQLVAWGRKPWLGLRFRSLFRTP